MYAFGEFVLDVQLYQLRRAGNAVPLEPKVFDVLCYLVENHARVATKQELLAALWPNEVVTEAVLPTNINALRRALGQQRGERTPIETVHGRGYRFAMPVSRQKDHASTPTLRAPRREPVLGQQPLFAKLRRVLAQALEGRGQVCVLSGEVGIGKTRSAERLAQAARAAGAEVWKVHAREDAPLWPLRELLQRAGEAGACSPTELAHLLPATGSASWPLGTSEELAALRLYEALLGVLTRPARARLVWIEDAQRADALTWQLLRMLAPQLERASVMLLLTVRNRDDLSAMLPLQEHLDALLRMPHGQRYLVRGLEPAHVQALAGELLAEEVSADDAAVLHARSGGNPLYVRELVAWLATRRDLTLLPPRLSPPELVRQLLRDRVRALGSDVRRALEAGAVLGLDFDASIVARMVSCGDALERATQHGLITPSDAPNGYRLHELLRDTLYADLPQRERRLLHAGAAAVLEERVAWLGLEGVRAVAQHLHDALPEVDPQRAVSWLERAASLCEHQARYRDATRLYRRALDAARLLPVSDPALAQKHGERQAWLAGMLRSAPVQS